jgi:hypothetical protein
MAIKYYPNRVFKKLSSPVDMAMRRTPSSYTISNQYDLTSDAAEDIISFNHDFQVNSIKIDFSDATERDYYVNIIGGRRVVTNLNDYLWFASSTAFPQRIILDQGFYTGTQLAAELQTKLNANTEFTQTFTVTYTAATGLFNVSVDAGTVQYLDVNTMHTLSTRDSIAGHLFGFNATSLVALDIDSDTEVYGLNSEVAIIDGTNSTVLSHYFDDVKVLNLDQAISIGSGSAAVKMSYEINYKEVV